MSGVAVCEGGMGSFFDMDECMNVAPRELRFCCIEEIGVLVY